METNTTEDNHRENREKLATIKLYHFHGIFAFVTLLACLLLRMSEENCRAETNFPEQNNAPLAGSSATAEEAQGPFRVGNRRCNGVIVYASATHRPAALCLRELLERITGTAIPLETTLPECSNDLCIHVGATAYVREQGLLPDNLHPYGYIMACHDGKNLVLAGANRDATYYAVYDFLHRLAGYRWFAPGKFGENITKREAIAIPVNFSSVEEPDIASYSNLKPYGSNPWYTRNNRSIFSHGHNFHRILPPEKFGDRPELYCLVDGKRFIPPSGIHGTWQPCVSHPDLPRITVDWAKEFFAANPAMRAFSACVNDGGGDCQCPDCTASMAKYGNQYIPFYNAVGELLSQEIPGKLACIYAYGIKSGVPPHDIQVHSNVCVILTAPLTDGGKCVEAWLSAGVKHLGFYDYLLGSRSVIPLHFPRLFGRAWQNIFHEHGLDLIHNELSIVSWYYDGPRQYVFDRLAWNMDESIDALLDEYFSGFYSAAAGPMLKFFNHIETVHLRTTDPFQLLNNSKNQKWLDAYTRDDLVFLDTCLDDAMTAAAEPTVKQRVRLFARLWGYSRLEVLARICCQELGKIGTDDPDRMLVVAQEACTALTAKDAYVLSTDEEKELLTDRMTFAEYKTILQQELYVESAVDAAFDRWRQVQSEEIVERFFGKLAGENSRLGRLARTQIYLLRHVPQDIAVNGGFESPAKNQPNSFADDIKQRYGWQSCKADGWHTWCFQRSRADFFWDETEAHSGQHSIAIGGTDISACFQQAIKVSPGERYRVSVWVKQNLPRPEMGLLSVRWMNAAGWRDQSGKPGQAPPFSVDLQEGAAEWRQLAGSFTVPEDVTTAIILLGVKNQPPNSKIWFDDVRFESILSGDVANEHHHSR